MELTMRNFITEQPETLQRVIDHAPAEVEKALCRLNGLVKRIFMVGSGTSLNAALAAKYVMEYYNDCEVQVIPPFDFLHYLPQTRISRDTLVIGISQTARSTGVIDVIDHARNCGARTVFMTATPSAPGTFGAETVIDTWTGDEPVGPKTKGFTSTMASLFYLAAGLAGKPLDLTNIPGFISQTIEISEKIMPECIDEFINASSIKIISCGPNLAVAHEGGLKALETVRVPVEVYDVEEFMHGPYHCLEKDSYMIFIAPPGKGQERMLRLVQFTQSITRHTIVIADEEIAKKGVSNIFIGLPGGIEEMLTPLGYIVPLQLLANDLTIKKGRRPEQSRYPNFHATLGSKITP